MALAAQPATEQSACEREEERPQGRVPSDGRLVLFERELC